MNTIIRKTWINLNTVGGIPSPIHSAVWTKYVLTQFGGCLLVEQYLSVCDKLQKEISTLCCWVGALKVALFKWNWVVFVFLPICSNDNCVQCWVCSRTNFIVLPFLLWKTVLCRETAAQHRFRNLRQIVYLQHSVPQSSQQYR